MKTNSAGVTTLQLAEGQEALDGVPDGVVLTGPGAPIHEALQARLAERAAQAQAAPAIPAAPLHEALHGRGAAVAAPAGTPVRAGAEKAAQGRKAAPGKGG